MAPTELLAEQHLRNFSLWFEPFDVQIIFLTGQLKGKQRQQALEAIADGSAGIIIGTPHIVKLRILRLGYTPSSFACLVLPSC
jgi:RecG-like helicase